MLEPWQASAAATLIGSMPHHDRQQAVNLIVQQMPEIPVWPQLPVYPQEQMMVQYLEGLPGLCTEQGRIFMQTEGADFERDLLSFYEDYVALEAGEQDLATSRFQMGAETARTLRCFLDTLAPTASRCKAVKGQVVGPFTLLSGLTDHNRRALLYDDRITDLVAKHLALKARWQIEQLKPLGRPIILFLDEPALAGYGSSAFISISADYVSSLLGEVIATVQQAGAQAGIHVCANTDWLLALRSSLDIINFDAYSYFERFALYKDEFTAFVERGGVMAWGMVPTGEPQVILQETAESLAERWLEQVQCLLGGSVTLKRVLAQSLFTPACGCGSLSEPLAERVLSLTRSLSDLMQAKLRG